MFSFSFSFSLDKLLSSLLLDVCVYLKFYNCPFYEVSAHYEQKLITFKEEDQPGNKRSNVDRLGGDEP